MKNIYLFDEQISSSNNGIGTYMKELISFFKNLDANIHMIVFNSLKPEFGIETKKNLKTYYFPNICGGNFLGHSSIFIKFFQLYIEDSIDNIFFLNHSPCAKLMENLKKSFPLSKIIFTIHDQGWTTSLSGDAHKFKKIISETASPGLQNMSFVNYFEEEKLMYNISDKIVCLSEDTYSLLEDLYKVNKDKILLIQNGLSDSYQPLKEKEKHNIRKGLFISPNEKVILYIGRIQESKGCKALLSSFKNVLKVYPRCRLVMAGVLYNPDLFLKETKSISSRISFTGRLSKEELKKWYQIADVGVIPSYTEQCSYVGIEMMMHQLPIIASDGWGLRKMFIDGYNAVIAPISNGNRSNKYEKNLANSIINILKNDGLRSGIIRNGRNEFEQKYNISQMKDRYKELIESV